MEAFAIAGALADERHVLGRGALEGLRPGQQLLLLWDGVPDDR
jgi:hypothetical protein